MAVPNTNTFSLRDVVDEINPTTNDLQDCINDANSGSYDPLYYTAPATSLLEFRNYGASLNSIVRSFFGSGDTFKCSSDYSSTTFAFIQRAGNIYEVGDIVYEDINGNTIFQGNDLWYRMKDDSNSADAGYVYKISNLGVISSRSAC